MPAVNWFLLVAVVALVIGFGSSTALASAYGIAVTGTITADTLLFLVVARALWKKPGWLVGIGAAVFFTVDLAFLGANLTKAEHGGWFPLSVGVVVFAVLSTWRRGTREDPRVADRGGGLAAVVRRRTARGRPAAAAGAGHGGLPQRPPRNDAARAAHASVEHAHALHESIVIISIETTRAPYVAEADHLVVDHLGYEDDGISHLTAKVGFQEAINVPQLFALACTNAASRATSREEDAVYFLSQVDDRARPTAPGMARLAQAPLRRPRPQRRQRRRLLPPARRPHRDDRLADRALVREGIGRGPPRSAALSSSSLSAVPPVLTCKGWGPRIA